MSKSYSPEVIYESTPGDPGEGPPDALVEAWVREVHAGLPNIDSQSSKDALGNLVSWMARHTRRVVRKLAAHFHLSHSVVEEMHKDLPHILRVFLTCPASGHTAASPAVTAYLHYAHAARLSGTEPRSFRKWCFFGTRTRLFSYLRQTARAYGAPAELFTHRESGQRARRRMVQAGKLIEYLRRERLPDGTETWCHRHLHPEGHRPPNAVPATERRFLTRAHAERHHEFTLTLAQIVRERRLEEQLGSGRGILEVRLLGNDSNPALLRWVFEQLHEPFPLLSTTLDAIFAANARACQTVTEAEKQAAPGSDDSDWLPAEDNEDDYS